MVDIVVPRPKLRETLATLIDLLRRRQPSGEIVQLATAKPAEAPAE